MISWCHAMDIFKLDMYRGPNIGIYGRATDDRVFVPRGYAEPKAARLAECLGAEPLASSAANTRLLGPLMVANNHGLLLPHTASDLEVAHYEKHSGLCVAVLGTRYTALGNMIAANDRGAVVSPAISAEDARRAAEALDVEVAQTRVAGYNQVGAMVVATSRGGVVHPEAADDEVAAASSVLGVRLVHATVNGGVPFVASGLLANNRAVVAGSMTTGPEIVMLTQAFSG